MLKVIKIDNRSIEVKDSININREHIDELIDKIVMEIINEYNKNDYELYDIVDSMCINNLSIQNVCRVYAKVYNIIEKDVTIRKYHEGGYLDITNDIMHK